MSEANLEERARSGPLEAQQVASNPTAPGALLERLSQSKDNHILRALAQNPNTPTSILFKLARRFPVEVLQNPVIPLLFLENPSILRAEIDVDAAKSFLSLPDCPEEFFHVIATHKDAVVRAEAAAHQKTPSEILERLKDDGAWVVNHALVQNPNTPPSVIGAFLSTGTPSIRSLAAKHPNVPQERLAFLVRVGVYFDKDSYNYGELLQLKDPQEITEEERQSLLQDGDFARTLVALHPSTPMSLLAELARDKSQQVRVAVASNPRLTDEVLALLDIKEYSIQLALCQNPSLPLFGLVDIASRKNTVLQKLIAKHPNVDEGIITQLLTEEDAALRLLALRSGKANQEYLASLYRAGASEDLSRIEGREALSDEERERLIQAGPFAKQIVAESHHTPTEVMWRLYELAKQDQSGLIIKGLIKNPMCPPSLLLRSVVGASQGNLLLIAQRADAPPELLAHFIEAQSAELRACAAFHRDTPHEALALLWRAGASPSLDYLMNAGAALSEQELCALSERGPFARELVAKNLQTPTYLLERLSTRSDYWLQAALLKNPNLTEAAIRNIPASYGDICLKLAEHRNTPADILQKIIKDNYYGTRARAAANANTAPAELTFLARDESRMVRDCVAANPNTSGETLSWLALEPRGRLQLALAKNPSSPENVLQRFALHQTAEIRDAARKNASLPASSLQLLHQAESLDRSLAAEELWLLFSLGGAAPALVARHPNTPTALLSEVARSCQKSMALLLARHPNTPVALLQTYQTSLHRKLREAVSQNPSCPPLPLAQRESAWGRYLAAQSTDTNPEELLQLAEAPEMHIREAIAKNPRASSQVLARLVHDSIYLVRCAVARHPNLSEPLALALANDRHAKVRACIARHLVTPPQMLSALATDVSAQVRRAVIQHPKTPNEALVRLAKDPKRRVRGLYQKK